MSTTTGEKAEESTSSNVRLKRFNDALDEFLKLIDEKASTENFQTALPRIKPKHVEPAKEQFIFHLKDSIKLEKDRLLVAYGLEDKLAELERLTEEAAQRRTAKGGLMDVWRPNLDLSTALYSRSIPRQRERVALLERELSDVVAENDELQTQLEQTMASEEEMRSEASGALQCLDETIEGLETSPELDRKIKERIQLLIQELGPRGGPSYYGMASSEG